MLHKNPSQSSLRGIFRIECDKKCDNFTLASTQKVIYSCVPIMVIFGC